jgi:uncharacterized membrane protein
MMFIGFAFVALIVYLLMKPGYRERSTESGRYGEDPIEILKRRYVQGAISEAEFVRMREELTSN